MTAAVSAGKTIAAATLEVLARMSEFERRQFFEKLGEHYCLYCGSTDAAEPRGCFCMRDD